MDVPSKGILHKRWKPLLPPPAEPIELQYDTSGQRNFHFVATGDVYTDGSHMPLRHMEEGGRSGWGVVRDSGDAVVGVFGNLPGESQNIVRAELYAILMALTYSDGSPLRIFTDHWNHVRAWCDGQEHCMVHWEKPHLDLWRRIWAKIDDIGKDRVKLVWV